VGPDAAVYGGLIKIDKEAWEREGTLIWGKKVDFPFIEEDRLPVRKRKSNRGSEKKKEVKTSFIPEEGVGYLPTSTA